MLTNFLGTSYILAVAVAYLADISVGKYKAVLISACIEFLGIGLLTTQAHFWSLKPPVCNIFDPTAHCEKVGGGDAAFLYISLYLMALGISGVKASIPTHGADQFDENVPKEALDMSSFFNWLLVSLSIGGSLGLSFVIWVQTEVGWDWGFGMSTIGLFLGIVVFTVGVPRYRIQVFKGTNPITEIIQRIGIGLVLSGMSMATAAAIEVKRKNVAESHGMLDAIPGLQPLSISVFWLTFHYFLFGFADMFTLVGLLEFFYSERPKKYKSIASSFLWCAMSLGYFLSSALVQMVNSATRRLTKSRGWLGGKNINRNHLDLFYMLLAILSLLNFLNYLYWAKRHQYKQQAIELSIYF